MAKPISKTPELEGEDAIAVLKKMHEPPTEKDKEFAREIRNQRIVLFYIDNPNSSISSFDNCISFKS